MSNTNYYRVVLVAISLSLLMIMSSIGTVSYRSDMAFCEKSDEGRAPSSFGGGTISYGPSDDSWIRSMENIRNEGFSYTFEWGIHLAPKKNRR